MSSALFDRHGPSPEVSFALLVALALVCGGAAGIGAHNHQVVAVPTGIAAFIGTGESGGNLSRAEASEPRCIAASLRWDRYGAGVVPLRDEGPGRLVPAIRWEEGGPLRGEGPIRWWYSHHPEHGLAITLNNPTKKLGLIDDDSGKHPVPEDKPRPRPLAGYREKTRSGGFHSLGEYRVALPDTVPRRVIGLGGYLDILLEGIVYVAPTVNAGRGEYSVVDDRDPPTFESVLLMLQAAEPEGHPWLVDAWRAARYAARGTGAFERVAVPVPKDTEELLARMTGASPAGAVAAWIAKNTDGAKCPPFLCFHVGHHAWAAGGSRDQVRAVVSCPHSEWGDGYVSLEERFRHRPPAGIAALRRFPEGEAAYRDLLRASPKAVADPTARAVIEPKLADWARLNARRRP